MKAYFLSIKDDPMEQGGYTVFANTVQEARKKVYEHDLDFDNWIEVIAYRDKKFDGMENLSDRELALAQWREGWTWYDRYDMPDSDESTDEEFYKWYKDNFKGKDE